jgi:hypothetical protein
MATKSKSKTKTVSRKPILTQSSPGYTRFLFVVIVVLLVGIGYFVVRNSHASTTSNSSCSPNAILVNPCRALVGAAAKGYTGPGITTDAASQFSALENLTGVSLDVYKDYHSVPGSGRGTDTLPLAADTKTGQAELNFLTHGTYVDINWEPAATFASADGSDPAVTANIDKTAQNFLALQRSNPGVKVFLSPWHEADLLVSARDSGVVGEQTCTSFAQLATRQMGSPGEYIKAWRYIHDRFAQDGVTNIIWHIGFSTYEPSAGLNASKSCWVPYLYPGDKYTDWISYDTYSNHKSFDDTAGGFYRLLDGWSTGGAKNAFGEPASFNDKPWAIGEFGDCNAKTALDAQNYYSGAPDASGKVTAVPGSALYGVQHNLYPKLKMWMVYADTGGPNPDQSAGCLTNTWPGEQQSFNALVKALITPSISPSPSVSIPPSPSGTITPSPKPSPTPLPTPTPLPRGNGLTGTYYPQLGFGGTPKVRIDKTVDFNWCFRLWFIHYCWGPIGSFSPDTYSIKWKGMVAAPNTGDYTFTTTTDDGARLFVNGQLLVDQWHAQPATSYSGTIHLVKGQKVPLTMWYFQNLGVAQAKLEWSAPGLKRQVIPTQNLFSEFINLPNE